ncbi:MAG TPA: hypothetical protein VFB28_06210 [Terriglobales bacterium]|nr:hypothetical protein [Terriglobales bacterium]
MKPRLAVPVVFSLLALVTLAAADQQKAPTPGVSSSAPRMSKQTRMDLMRAFNAELVYVRTPFPMGKKGLTLKDGKITPGQQELQQLIAMWGPAVKPGDRAMITDVEVKDDRIHFEINGGPVKKQKWYQRIQVSGSGGSAVPLGRNDSTNNPRGSYVDLVFAHYVPDMNPQELKDLLRPVFDFNAKTAVEAYLDTVPPKVKEAIKNHNVLVGMNREMVIYAKGRAPKKTREKDGDAEYEEWIYGEPPQDVDFVRFVGDEVVRVETMKVGGEKVVRTDKEVTLEPQPTVAKEQPEARPANAPTLRRPGEDVDTSMPKTAPSASPLPPVASPPSPGGPNPNPSAPPPQSNAPPQGNGAPQFE